MTKRKRKTGMEDATAIVMGFANLVDTLFLRYTGKTMQTLLKEFGERPKELPQGEKAEATAEPDMPLDWAYSVLGLSATASLDEVKQHYRNLARVFHPDAGGYKEAMVLLNRAYERITKGKAK